MRSRQFAVAVLACVAAAGIALFAASRTWLVEVVARPDPLPPSTVAHSGGSLMPLLPALALVGLAGAGGLLASRGKARLAVAVLLILVGLAIPASVAALVTRTGITVGWVLVTMLAGLAVTGVGVAAITRGPTWPTMGARYERSDGRVKNRKVNNGKIKDGKVKNGKINDRVTQENVDNDPPAGARVGGAETSGRAGRNAAGFWDAVDRGEDPTKE